MPIKYKEDIMARYNRDFLVPYLEDICALHLSKQKIHRMIELSNQEISKINKTALENVGDPKLERYENEGSLYGVGTGCLGSICSVMGVVFLFGSFFGEHVAAMIILAIASVVVGILLAFRSMGAKDRVNVEIKARNDARERDHAIAQMAALVVAEPQVNAIKERISVLENEIQKIDTLLEKQYSINVIPGWYRDLYPAVYLYDWFSNSRANDLDVALNTLVLEQIKDRLDTIIRNQSDMIINQRIMIANQQKSMEQADRHHATLMAKLDRIEATNEDRNMYLSMIEANTAANAYFSAANYLKQ